MCLLHYDIRARNVSFGYEYRICVYKTSEHFVHLSHGDIVTTQVIIDRCRVAKKPVKVIERIDNNAVCKDSSLNRPLEMR